MPDTSTDPEWDDRYGDHAVYTLVDWQCEVGACNTRLSYRQWVARQIEEEGVHVA